jgi:hypothetical protein
MYQMTHRPVKPARLRDSWPAVLYVVAAEADPEAEDVALYHRTDNDFDAVGIAWQVRWGGGL